MLPHPSASLMKGFFATRFVDAVDEQEAVRRAVDVVRQELMQVLSPEEARRTSITVDEIRVDPLLFDQYAPGRGFTWFP